ncbi:MAG: glycosyltransferase, partial [Caldilineaceae bacterium]
MNAPRAAPALHFADSTEPGSPRLATGRKGTLRVLMVSKALVVGAYQRKAEELASLGLELTVVTPPVWADARGAQALDRQHTQGYELVTLPVRMGGHFHLFHYPGLPRLLAMLSPALLHMDEEPYNAATWHALRAAHALGIPATFFTWQNLLRNYPPPFRQMERAVYRWAPLALAGGDEAEGVLRAKGYGGEVAVFPQFGVDARLYSPEGRVASPTLRIGYAGGLLPEKGVDLLLRASLRLAGDWSLDLIGEGAERPALAQLAGELGIADHTRFVGRVNSAQMPG